MAFGFRECDRSASAGAGVNAFLHFHAEVVSPLKFLRRHEFNAHFLRTVWNRLFELKVPGSFDGRIPQPPKDVGQRWVRSPEGDHVEEEVEILGSPGFGECELNCLGAGDDEIFRCGGRAQRGVRADRSAVARESCGLPTRFDSLGQEVVRLFEIPSTACVEV